jgi:hypothetical protein
MALVPQLFERRRLLVSRLPVLRILQQPLRFVRRVLAKELPRFFVEGLKQTRRAAPCGLRRRGRWREVVLLRLRGRESERVCERERECERKTKCVSNVARRSI